MAQETRNVDYESMVEKYMNEWDGCNLREFCFSEKVNIYRMLKTMKKMGVKKEVIPHGLKPLEFPDARDTDDVDEGKACFDDGCVHNVKLTCGRDVQVVIKRCSPEVLVRLLHKLRVFYYHHRGFILTEKVLSEGKFLRPIYTNNICEREMRTVGTLRNNSLFWGSHTSAKRLSVILTIVRSALMNSLNVYQYIVYCLKTIRSYKGDLADLLANKWKPSDTELMPILA